MREAFDLRGIESALLSFRMADLCDGPGQLIVHHGVTVIDASDVANVLNEAGELLGRIDPTLSFLLGCHGGTYDKERESPALPEENRD
ncbi:MAG: hypothetical protein U1E56_11385 [Bauldia sp.]